MERRFHSAFTSVVQYLNIPPYLYRYENQEFINRFFETGEILISSFYQYSRYTDNQLGDKSEGSAVNHGSTKDGKTVFAVTSFGHNAYCFCTSTLLQKDLFEVFKRNSAFRIKDPINFILQIEKSLTRVTEVLYGNCIYLPKRILSKEIGELDLEKMRINDGSNNLSMDLMFQKVGELAGPEQLFLKNISYQQQSEYRLLWLTDVTIDNPIILKCPEAVKFCEKIDF